MKKNIVLLLMISFLIGCTSEDNNPDTNITVSIEATGLNDDKLALNNAATFTAMISGFEGDASSLSYRWRLSNENGELSDGVNPLPNPSISGTSINCVGKTAGEEEIMLEVLDASNALLALASYSFTIVQSDDAGGSFGCFDQPKLIYQRGTFNFVLNFDGTNEESLGIGGGSGVAISPDGEWIAHARSTLPGWQMNLFRCDGSTGLIPVEQGPFEIADILPKFSLDGSKLYFLRTQPPGPNTPSNSFPSDIVAYDLETGDLTNLTSLVQQDEFVLGSFAVSPVTGDIAFLRQSFISGEVKLSFVQPESGLITDFTTLPEGIGNSTLDWSPDGGDIIFRAAFNSMPGIYRINVTSGSQPLLVFADQTPNTTGPLTPFYYEGGSRIVFVDQNMGQPSLNLWTIDANGNDLQPLLNQSSGNLFLWGILR